MEWLKSFKMSNVCAWKSTFSQIQSNKTLKHSNRAATSFHHTLTTVLYTGLYNRDSQAQKCPQINPKPFQQVVMKFSYLTEFSTNSLAN